MDIKTRALNWAFSGDTGISSEAICSAILGLEGGTRYSMNTPSDPADFGRCYRLLELIPEWKPELHKVAEKFPSWGPLVEAWDELTASFESMMGNDGDDGSALYEQMRGLRDACYLADGWEKVCEGYWEKKGTGSVLGLGE